MKTFDQTCGNCQKEFVSPTKRIRTCSRKCGVALREKTRQAGEKKKYPQTAINNFLTKRNYV